MSTIDAMALLAHHKQASGGARWDEVSSVREHGTMSMGGLAGEFHALRDLRTGRYASHHALGPITGAAGFDGVATWQRGPGGEIAVLDAPEAKRRARTQAWIDARAYWYPERFAARFAPPVEHAFDARAYHVIDALPDDGDALALWFNAETYLLARIVRRRGGDTVMTAFDDYRDVDGVMLPFRTTTDRADANGNVDARQCSVIALDRIEVDVAVTDTDFAVPTMTVAARIDDASGLTRIPFDLANNHIYVDGSVDGKPVRLMVDTGGANLLTPAAAQRLGLTSAGRLGASGPGERTTDVALARAAQVRVGAAILDKPVFYVIDLAELPAVEGVAFDGLIGYEMFRHFGVTIDYAKRVLELADRTRFLPPANATAIPFEFDRLTPIVSGTLDGMPVRLMVDTGSRAALTLSAPFVHSNDLAARYRAAPEAVLGWGIGGAVRLRAARFGKLVLADLAIEGIAGDLFTGGAGALTNPDHAGNLGGGVLNRFTVAFDYAVQRMYLAPNDAFNRIDAFDCSGLWLLADGAALRVADVADDSAASRAGVVIDDRIVSIDGEAVGMRDLAQWREHLRESTPGSEVAIALLRGRASHRTTLVLADRIPAQGVLLP
jgi:hypothetical protein